MMLEALGWVIRLGGLVIFLCFVALAVVSVPSLARAVMAPRCPVCRERHPAPHPSR